MIELVPHDVAHGGEAVARVDGKAHFVAGAIPGERVRGEIALDKGSWARVRLHSVVEASPDRVAPPCRHFAQCGGCQWQFAAYDAQLAWKRSIVAGQLAHVGRIAAPNVEATLAVGDPFGYRNRMDFRVEGGRPALHRARSSHLVPIEHCLLLHPSLHDVFGRLDGLGRIHKLTLRTGVRTGERLAVIEGEPPAGVDAWGIPVARRSRHGYEAIVGTKTIHEEVAGVRFRITGSAFFQNNTSGAEALTRLVGDALDLTPDDTVLDAYAGVGLFAATSGSRAGRVIAVERNRTAVSDLRHNLRRLQGDDGPEFAVVAGSVEDAVGRLEEYWTAAIVDPPRTGLGDTGVAAVTAALPRTIVYVACDPASLGRDARLLDAAGYDLDAAQPVDLFPHTFHIETVARFVRRSA